ncbi:hypothetical protein [Calothrix sp. 336/3]|uniref:hypothetical protein n=1 Tax=Calothrix sp. 336/3 TaxID=1337936 RepID=UPI0004E2BA0D|nr:hypothetical protein [Calothrix sp. 336/3]AKG23477.1 hypothetical protein IJ00_21310 [Calothrix sp. 336/3]
MTIQLGFGSVPKPQYIFVAHESDYCWYMLSDDKKQIPIYQRALTGVITAIECNKSVVNSFGIAYKTDLHILADKPYIIRSGRDAFFSKSLLLSLDNLNLEQLQKPITITVNPGEKKVVFCTIYDPINYQAIDINWERHQDIDLTLLEQKILHKISKLTPGSTSNSSELRTMIIAQTDKYLLELAWTKEQGRQYLQQKYGKRSRHQLTEVELLEFMIHLWEIAGKKQSISMDLQQSA